MKGFLQSWSRSSLSFRSGIVEQNEHASEREIRLPRGNMMRVMSRTSVLTILATCHTYVTVARGEGFWRFLACSFCSTITERKQRLLAEKVCCCAGIGEWMVPTVGTRDFSRVLSWSSPLSVRARKPLAPRVVGSRRGLYSVSYRFLRQETTPHCLSWPECINGCQRTIRGSF